MVNGALTDAATASLRINDLALLRGYGAFDFFLVRKGIPMFAEDHIDRFFYSAEYLKLKMPCTKSELLTQVYTLIDANGMDEAGIRMQLTGGYASDSYTPVAPNIVIIQSPYVPYPKERYDTGVKMLLHEYQREMSEIKLTNYVRGIWMLDKLKEANASDVLYHRNGVVSESARSNFFIVNEQGTIVTPDANILEGVTRKHVLIIAKKHYQVEVRPLKVTELFGAKEAFMTSTIKEVLPVTRIDDMQIGDGLPGPVVKNLTLLMHEYKREYRTRHNEVSV